MSPWHRKSCDVCDNWEPSDPTINDNCLPMESVDANQYLMIPKRTLLIILIPQSVCNPPEWFIDIQES